MFTIDTSGQRRLLARLATTAAGGWALHGELQRHGSGLDVEVLLPDAMLACQLEASLLVGLHTAWELGWVERRLTPLPGRAGAFGVLWRPAG